MSSEIVKLNQELAELREYKDHHEFVASQLEEVLGEPLKNLGQVVEQLRRLKDEKARLNVYLERIHGHLIADISDDVLWHAADVIEGKLPDADKTFICRVLRHLAEHGLVGSRQSVEQQRDDALLDARISAGCSKKLDADLARATSRVIELEDALVAVRDCQDLGDAAQAIIKTALGEQP